MLKIVCIYTHIHTCPSSVLFLVCIYVCVYMLSIMCIYMCVHILKIVCV